MQQSIKTGWVLTVFSSLLILLFVYTASSKLLDMFRFEIALSKMPYLQAAAPVLSWALPLVELYISMLLLLPASRKKGFGLSFILLLAFTLYLGLVLLLAPHLPCSCGGVISELGWRDHFLFNTAFILMAYAGWRLEKTGALVPTHHSADSTFYSNKPPAGGRQA